MLTSLRVDLEAHYFPGNTDAPDHLTLISSIQISHKQVITSAGRSLNISNDSATASSLPNHDAGDGQSRSHARRLHLPAWREKWRTRSRPKLYWTFFTTGLHGAKA
jgi:hypothetical protein